MRGEMMWAPRVVTWAPSEAQALQALRGIDSDQEVFMRARLVGEGETERYGPTVLGSEMWYAKGIQYHRTRDIIALALAPPSGRHGEDNYRADHYASGVGHPVNRWHTGRDLLPTEPAPTKGTSLE